MHQLASNGSSSRHDSSCHAGTRQAPFQQRCPVTAWHCSMLPSTVHQRQAKPLHARTSCASVLSLLSLLLVGPDCCGPLLLDPRCTRSHSGAAGHTRAAAGHTRLCSSLTLPLLRVPLFLRPLPHSPVQILSNAVLLVDKPVRWSSADVVRQLKAALKLDKVCFGAPLDTEATGLLIILLGEAGLLLLLLQSSTVSTDARHLAPETQVLCVSDRAAAAAWHLDSVLGRFGQGTPDMHTHHHHHLC